jgi:hypothetical protein
MHTSTIACCQNCAINLCTQLPSKQLLQKTITFTKFCHRSDRIIIPTNTGISSTIWFSSRLQPRHISVPSPQDNRSLGHQYITYHHKIFHLFNPPPPKPHISTAKLLHFEQHKHVTVSASYITTTTGLSLVTPPELRHCPDRKELWQDRRCEILAKVFNTDIEHTIKVRTYVITFCKEKTEWYECKNGAWIVM